jgi:hypothetical protein
MVDTDTDRASSGEVTTLTDRRRQGRVNYQNPHLIALLRKPDQEPREDTPPVEPIAQQPLAEVDENPDSLAPARGLFVGIVLGTGLWVTGALVIWMCL